MMREKEEEEKFGPLEEIDIAPPSLHQGFPPPHACFNIFLQLILIIKCSLVLRQIRDSFKKIRCY